MWCNGLGVWKTTPSMDATTPITWTEIGQGIEQLVAQDCVSPPGCNPSFSFYDRAVMTPTPGVFPSTYYPLTQTSPEGDLLVGWSLDYAPNSSTVVALVNFNDVAEQSGVSNDGGKTWNAFGTQPPAQTSGSVFIQQGGQICAASPA